MEFAVTNDTLIPRSDSEVLIEALVVRRRGKEEEAAAAAAENNVLRLLCCDYIVGAISPTDTAVHSRHWHGDRLSTTLGAV